MGAKNRVFAIVNVVRYSGHGNSHSLVILRYRSQAFPFPYDDCLPEVFKDLGDQIRHGYTSILHSWSSMVRAQSRTEMLGA